MGRVIDIHDPVVESVVVNRPTTVARKSHYMEDEAQIRPVSNNIIAQQRLHSSRSGKKCTVSLRSIKVVILASRLSFFTVFVPAAIFASNYLYVNEGLVFLLSFLSIIPLTERLRFVTKQLAFFTGSRVRGLVNVGFGNATELIIAIYGLKSGLIQVVRHSLLGSILSNILLHLGCVFYWNGDQLFDKESAAVDSRSLLMAIIAILFPSVLQYTRSEERYWDDSDMGLSRFYSFIMLISYVCYISYQIKSRWSLQNSGNEHFYQPEQCLKTLRFLLISLSVCAYRLKQGGESGEESNNETEHVPQMSKWEAIVWLVILIILISILSEYLMHNIVAASAVWGIPVGFVSVVIIPIAGNAAEHVCAMLYQTTENMDISLGNAVRSSTQITMFTIPFCVTLGWIMDVPLDLNFQIFEITTLFLTLLVVAFFLKDDTSNYYKGLMLMFCYLIIAASFFIKTEYPFTS